MRWNEEALTNLPYSQESHNELYLQANDECLKTRYTFIRGSLHFEETRKYLEGIESLREKNKGISPLNSIQPIGTMAEYTVSIF